MTAPLRRFWWMLAAVVVLGAAILVLAAAVFHSNAWVLIAIVGAWALLVGRIVGRGFTNAVHADEALKSDPAVKPVQRPA